MKMLDKIDGSVAGGKVDSGETRLSVFRVKS
jgi:hypothetical protein